MGGWGCVEVYGALFWIGKGKWGIISGGWGWLGMSRYGWGWVHCFKMLIRKFKRQKVYSSFRDNIWDVDLAICTH